MKNKKLLAGLAALVALGSIAIGTLIYMKSEPKHKTTAYPTTQSSILPATQPAPIPTPNSIIPSSEPAYVSRVTRTMNTIYFHFKAPNAIENLYLIDGNGQVLSKIIEDSAPKIKITLEHSFSGGEYNGVFYDLEMVEGTGNIAVPQTLNPRLLIKLRGQKEYTEETIYNKKVEERLQQRIQDSLKR